MGVPTGHRMGRVLKGLVLAFLLAAVLGFSYEQVGRWRDSQHRFRVGRAVDIDGAA
jgi:hypothetical protein